MTGEHVRAALAPAHALMAWGCTLPAWSAAFTALVTALALSVVTPPGASAQSQIWSVEKQLCEGDPNGGPEAAWNGGCNKIEDGGLAPVLDSLYYAIRLVSYQAQPQAVTFTEVLPAGFVVEEVDCVPHPQTPPAAPADTPVSLTLTLPAGGAAYCTFRGWFDSESAGTVADNRILAGNMEAFRATHPIAPGPERLAVDLSVTKSVVWVGGPGLQTDTLYLMSTNRRIRYRITVRSDSAVDLMSYVQVADHIAVPSAATPVLASYVPGSFSCTNLDADGNVVTADQGCMEEVAGSVQSSLALSPNQSWGLSPLAVWSPPHGQMAHLSDGGRLELEFTVELDWHPAFPCRRDDDAIWNRAYLVLAGTTTILLDAEDDNNDTLLTSGNVPVRIVTGFEEECTSTTEEPPPPPEPVLEIEKLRHLPSDWEWGGANPPNLLERIWICLVTFFAQLVDNVLGWNINTSAWMFTYTNHHEGPPNTAYWIRITNVSEDVTAQSINLTDSVYIPQFTPPFTAELTSQLWLYCPDGRTCRGEQPSAPVPMPGQAQNSTMPWAPLVPPGPGTLHSFESVADVWRGRINALEPGESVVLRIDLNYRDPACDSAADHPEKFIHNIMAARYTAVRNSEDEGGNPTVETWPGGAQASRVDRVEAPEACDFSVTKTLASGEGEDSPDNRIVFGEEISYTVTYRNNMAIPQSLGTVMDALRIATPGYASGLHFRYQFNCAADGNVTDFVAANTPNSTIAPGYTEAIAFPAGQPHQGTRIISQELFNPVQFGPGAALVCTVTLIVDRPASGNPFCLGDTVPMLENLAMMDVSAVFNPNLGWPPTNMITGEETSWATFQTPMPRCYDLIVNKSVTPPVVSPSGGPLTYTVQIQNTGTPLGTGEFGWLTVDGQTHWYGPVLTDVLDEPYPLPGQTFTLTNDPCDAGGQAGCEWQGGGIGDNPSLIYFTELPGGALSFTYQLSGPFEPGMQVCNTATVMMSLPSEELRQNWYQRAELPDDGDEPDPHAAREAGRCVPVLGAILIDKQVEAADPQFAPLLQQSFLLDVSCGIAGLAASFNEQVTVTPGQPTLVEGMLYGSQCTVSEPPQSAPAGCWWDVSFPGGASVSPQLGADPPLLNVVNTLSCTETGGLTLRKTWAADPSDLVPPAQMAAIVTSYAGGVVFDLSCQPPQGTGLTAIEQSHTYLGVPLTIDGLPAGSVCTVTEQPLPPPPLFEHCRWNSQIPGGEGIVIEAGENQLLTPQNMLICQPFSPPVPDLSIHKSVGECGFDGECTFDITVTNHGPGSYYGPIHFYDQTVTGVWGSLVGVQPPDLNCSASGGYQNSYAICQHPGAPLPLGEGSSLNYSLTVGPLAVTDPDIGHVENCAFFPDVAGFPQYWTIHHIAAALAAQGYLSGALDAAGLPAAVQAFAADQGISANDDAAMFAALLGPDFDPQNPPTDYPDNNRSCVTITPPPPPASLVIEKTQISPQCFGGECEFQITVTNAGEEAYSGPLEVLDAAGFGAPGSFWQAGTGNVVAPALVAHDDASVWACVVDMTSAWPVQCVAANEVTLLPGQSISLNLTFDLPPQVSWDINCARLAVPAGAGDSCTPIGSPPELHIEKTHVSGDCMPSGSQCRYRITVTNSGDQPYSGQLTVDEAFAFMTGGQEPFSSPDWPQAVVYVGHTPEDWNCAHTGEWPPISCTHPGVTLPAGGSTSFEIDLFTNHPAPATRNCVRLSAPPVANAPAGGPTDCTPIGSEPPPPAQLRIEKTGMSEGLMEPGVLGPVNFTLAVTNPDGAVAGAHTLTVTDAVPANMVFNSIQANGWDCGPNSQFPLHHPGSLTCVLAAPGGIPAGHAFPSIGVMAAPLANSQTGDTFLNCAVLSLQAGTGPSVIEDESCWTGGEIAGGFYDFAIEKTGSLQSGLNAEFTVTVSNLGEDFHGQGTITVTDTVPLGMAFLAASGQSWSCVPVGSPDPFPIQAGGVLTCIYNAAPVMPSGSLPPLNIQVVISPNTQPGAVYQNCATVILNTGAGYSDANPDNDTSCTTIVLPPDWSAYSQPPEEVMPPPDPACDPTTTVLRDGRCDCRVRGMTRVDALRCACPRGTRLEGGQCVAPPPACDPATAVLRGGVCACRFAGMTQIDALRCVCPAGTTLAPGEGCIPAGPQCDPATAVLRDGACVCRSGDMTRVDATRCACPPRHVFNVEIGRCTPLFCPPPMRLSDDRTECVCPAGQTLREGVCVETGRNLDRAIEILAPVIRDGARPPSRDPGAEPHPQPQPSPNCTPGGPVPC